MKIKEKLTNRLRKEFPDLMQDIPNNETPRRLYHGRNQRAIGAWSWCIGGNKNCRSCVGSQWSMRYILNSKVLSPYIENQHEVAIIPE